MPVFRDYSQTNRAAENGLLSRQVGHCPGFSPQGTCAVRFQAGIRRMQCDQKTWIRP